MGLYQKAVQPQTIWIIMLLMQKIKLIEFPAC